LPEYCRRCIQKISRGKKEIYEIARGSLIEVDAALDVANSLGYLVNYDLKTIEESIVSTFKLLCGMINPDPKS
jgi:four helix bundle protein